MGVVWVHDSYVIIQNSWTMAIAHGLQDITRGFRLIDPLRLCLCGPIKTKAIRVYSINYSQPSSNNYISSLRYIPGLYACAY